MFFYISENIDVYIPHCKYHGMHHSSPWFSAAWIANVVSKREGGGGWLLVVEASSVSNLSFVLILIQLFYSNFFIIVL